MERARRGTSTRAATRTRATGGGWRGRDWRGCASGRRRGRGAGRGRVLSLAAGRVFEVRGHPEGGWNEKLLPVRVTHEGRREEGSGAVQTHYQTSFFGIAASRAYRPLRRTARPAGHGCPRATVVGPGRGGVHTDQHGRGERG